MAEIGFIGLGNMGGPMAANLIKAGHQASGFRPVAGRDREARRGWRRGSRPPRATRRRARRPSSPCCPRASMSATSILGPQGLIAAARARHACSSIARPSTWPPPARSAPRPSGRPRDARRSGLGRHRRRARRRRSPSWPAAAMRAFARAQPILACMGKTAIHAGGPGNGQAAKICNNMILGISMIGVSEAFALGEKLGLSHQTLFDIASKSSGQCWSLTSYCPVPGPVPASPANRDYAAGLHGRDDAEGPEARPSGKPRCERKHPAWSGSRRALRAVRSPRRGRRSTSRRSSSSCAANLNSG